MKSISSAGSQVRHGPWHNILRFTEACLSNVLRLETPIQDAERDGDSELADFFRRAQSDSRKGADEGKRILASLLAS